MIDVQRSALIHPCDHMVVGVVESVHPDYTGLGLHVGVVRVSGVKVVFKHRQPIQVLNLMEREQKEGSG